MMPARRLKRTLTPPFGSWPPCEHERLAKLLKAADLFPMRLSLILLSVLALLLAALAVAVALAFQRDMQRAYERIGSRGQVLASPFGDIEFLRGGAPAGPVVLVVHGSGGGVDQGELLARAVFGREAALRWVVPSRFGYLRSTFRPGATFEDQADAYAFLLDHLGIEQVAVLAFSHGGPSALLFALRHPQRVSSLTLISAGVAASGEAQQAQANDKGAALVRLFQHDLAYWALTHAMRAWFLDLMGVSAAVAAGLTPAQRALSDELIDGMNPVSRRAAGAVFDNRARMPDAAIAAIRAPTLIVHARDDGLQLFHNAAFAAQHIKGARLEAFERGGHLLLAVEQTRVAALVMEHLRAHPPRATR